MTDYKQEQADELEALLSIFPDEIEQSTETSFGVRLKFNAGTFKDITYEGSVTLAIGYVPHYPDEIPIINLMHEENIPMQDIADLGGLLKKQAEENTGMPMVFMLHGFVNEWLENFFGAQKKSAEDAEQKLKDAENLRELERLTAGTVMTNELFFEWKKKFDKEVQDKLDPLKQAEIVRRKGKLTGRQVFEKDATMKNSDVTHSTVDDVVVDVSVFEALDLEDLDDEDEEDEDKKQAKARSARFQVLSDD